MGNGVVCCRRRRIGRRRCCLRLFPQAALFNPSWGYVFLHDELQDLRRIHPDLPRIFTGSIRNSPRSIGLTRIL